MSNLEGRIATWVAEDVRLAQEYKAHKTEEAKLLYELKREFPDEFNRWQQGIDSFEAYGVRLPVKRSYDIDKLKSLLGEEHPELFTTETVTREKVNGRALQSLWRDAAMARKLADTVIPPSPKLEVRK